jgi:hypothetical protein
MHRVLQKARGLRVLVVLAALATSVVMTAQPAMAIGPSMCVPGWLCEVTFNSVDVDGVAETEYSCTVISTTADVTLTTGVRCFIAVAGGISAVIANGVTGSNTVAWHYTTGPTSTWANVVPGTYTDGGYWVCLTASSRDVSNSYSESQNHCQVGAV